MRWVQDPSWEPGPAPPFPRHPLTPAQGGPFTNGTQTFYPFLFFRALAIIEKSKSPHISGVSVSGFGAPSHEFTSQQASP